MPQLDTVTFMSQFFWLCFFFFGFYLCLVQFILPKMARILKFRQQKILKIQKARTENKISHKRWESYLSCLNIQKKLAEANITRAKEISEESWQNSVALKSYEHFDKAFSYDNELFNKHMLSQNSAIAYFFVVMSKRHIIL